MSPIGVLVGLAQQRQGTRPVFRGWPLQLIPVANRPLIAHALGELRSVGVDRLVLVTVDELAPPLASAVGALAPGVPLEVVRVAGDAGDAEAVAAARASIGGRAVVVHTGHALVGGALASCLERVQRPGVDAVVLTAAEQRGHEGAEAILTRRFAHRRRSTGLGVSVLSAAALDALSSDSAQGTLGEALSHLNVEEHEVEDGWALGEDVGALLEGNRIALSSLQASWHPSSIRRSTVEGQVIIHPTAVVEDSLVRGPALIGPAVVVRHAYVGPFTSIAGGSVVENAEIEHSIVLHDVRIRHIGWRLERSVIGDRVEISREFRLPQAVNLHIGDDARISMS